MRRSTVFAPRRSPKPPRAGLADQFAGGPADAAADVRHQVRGGHAQRRDRRARGAQAAGVHVFQRNDVLGVQVVGVLAVGTQRRLDPAEQVVGRVMCCDGGLEVHQPPLSVVSISSAASRPSATAVTVRSSPPLAQSPPAQTPARVVRPVPSTAILAPGRINSRSPATTSAATPSRWPARGLMPDVTRGWSSMTRRPMYCARRSSLRLTCPCPQRR